MLCVTGDEELISPSATILWGKKKTGDETHRPPENDGVKGEEGGGRSTDFADIEHIVVFVDQC